MKEGRELHITVVDNGMLIASPSDRPVIMDQQGNQQQQRPKIHHCADFDELCDYLKELLVIE